MKSSDFSFDRESDALFQAILSLKTKKECEQFFRDLCTLSELNALTERFAVARKVREGKPYRQIAKETGASTATVTRVAQWLRNGSGGYELVLGRLLETHHHAKT